MAEGPARAASAPALDGSVGQRGTRVLGGRVDVDRRTAEGDGHREGAGSFGAVAQPREPVDAAPAANLTRGQERARMCAPPGDLFDGEKVDRLPDADRPARVADRAVAQLTGRVRTPAIGVGVAQQRARVGSACGELRGADQPEHWIGNPVGGHARRPGAVA
jgi:hypothetical protein